jgi:hypothetical protein
MIEDINDISAIRRKSIQKDVSELENQSKFMANRMSSEITVLDTMLINAVAYSSSSKS